MMRKVGISILGGFLLFAWLLPCPVQAQDELVVQDSSVRVEFPAGIDFHLSAAGGADITDIRLRYNVERASFAQVTSEVYLDFEPDAVVDARWTLDMVKLGGLPPGACLEYWWVIEDAVGNRLETPPERVQFDDNRYSWQSLTEGGVTIYWYQGDVSFAGELMAIAQQALAYLAQDTGAHLEKPVKMYIYADSRDLQKAMIFPHEWTGGVSFSRFGIIAMGISPDRLAWGQRVIPHELTHLVIFQVTDNPYGGIPTWLDEGLAMYTEGALAPEFAAVLDKAVAGGSLISVRSLASPFSAYTESSFLSYAQSYRLVEFLITYYGQDRMLELLNTFQQGSRYDDALEKVYGFDMDGLDALWRGNIGMPNVMSEPVGGIIMTPILVGVLAVLSVALFIVLVLLARSLMRR